MAQEEATIIEFTVNNHVVPEALFTKVFAMSPSGQSSSNTQRMRPGCHFSMYVPDSSLGVNHEMNLAVDRPPRISRDQRSIAIGLRGTSAPTVSGPDLELK
jgi:hypothetical protein